MKTTTISARMAKQERELYGCTLEQLRVRFGFKSWDSADPGLLLGYAQGEVRTAAALYESLRHPDEARQLVRIVDFLIAQAARRIRASGTSDTSNPALLRKPA